MWDGEGGGWEDGRWGGGEGDNNPRFRILDGSCWRYREKLERVDLLLLKKTYLLTQLFC